MTAVKKQVSRRQQRMLSEASEASPWELPRIMINLFEMPEEEVISPKWRRLWLANRQDLLEEDFFPEEYLTKIDGLINEIPLIDNEIRQLRLESTDQVCFLLGAGASAPEPSGIPTIAHLLPELWNRAGKIGREDIENLKRWCEAKGISNIEDLLTAAYLANFASKNAAVTGLLDYFLFRAGRSDEEESRRHRGRYTGSRPRVDTSSIALLQDTLQGLFGLLTGAMIPASPNKGHDAIVKFLKKHPKSSIVTTNYDGCIDEALLSDEMPLNTYVNETSEMNDAIIDLIKIHGSINWTYCDSCHQVREFPLLKLKDSFLRDSISYSVIGICRNCGGQRRPLLIPPMGLKFIMFPNLIKLWNAARIQLEKADYIIVVGFSFSEADTYINKIIERSMTQKETQKLIVCDPDTRLVENLRSLFSARIDDFDSSRVLPASGSSDELLPEMLASLVSKRESTKTTVAKPKPRRRIQTRRSKKLKT